MNEYIYSISDICNKDELINNAIFENIMWNLLNIDIEINDNLLKE